MVILFIFSFFLMKTVSLVIPLKYKNQAKVFSLEDNNYFRFINNILKTKILNINIKETI
jgi:hypothetical protein